MVSASDLERRRAGSFREAGAHRSAVLAQLWRIAIGAELGPADLAQQPAQVGDGAGVSVVVQHDFLIWSGCVMRIAQ